MANARLQTDLHDVDDSDFLPPTIRGLAQGAVDDDLDRIIGELRGGNEAAAIRLYRLAPGTRKETYIENIPPETSSALEYVKNTHGGGDYRVKVYVAGRLNVNESISIEGDKKLPAVSTSPGPGDLGALISVLREGQDKQTELLLRAISTVAQPPQNSRRAFFEEMALMKNLFSSNQPAADPMAIFSVFQQGMETMKNMAPREGEPGAMDVIMEGIKHLAPVFSQARPVAAQASALSAPEVQGAIIQPQTTGADTDMNIQTRMALGFLVQQAKRNGDVPTYADLVLDQMGDKATKGFISAPDWFERICAFNNEAANYRPWFDALRAELLSILTESPEAGNTSAHGSDTTT